MEEKLSYRNTVRLFAGEKCFGPGVAQLLRHVQEFHSLRSAAKAMNMAYSKAWTIVKSSERILGVQLPWRCITPCASCTSSPPFP